MRGRYGGLVILRKRGEFLRTQRFGQRARGRFVVVLSTPSRSEDPRLGFTVSKRLGRAVHRNRVRRRLKEIVRTQVERLRTSTDYVVIAYPGAVQISYSQLAADVCSCFGRLIRRSENGSVSDG